MPYDTTQTTAENPSTTIVQPPPDPAPQQAVPTQAAPAQQQSPQEAAPFPPAAGASGQPQQAVVTAQSEPTPQNIKPPIDPRPYALLKSRDPEEAQIVDHAAEVSGVSPERIAAHFWAESRFNSDAPRGADGEIGPMQMMPGTAAKYTAGGRLDPFNPSDNVLMAAMHMRDLDNTYGKDSFASVAHYNGTGPQAVAYARKLMPGAPESAEMQMHAQGSMTPQGLVKAGTEGGPDGFLQYATQTAPAGMATSDVWRSAEAHLVNAFILKGDLAGAQHARDFVLQMSHAGSNMYLMGADQALSRGDGVGAANMLAKAHAFFPDDTIGRFRSDGRNVWADRIDEGTGQRLGPSIPITPGAIRGLLNQTQDPAQYLKTLNENQKAMANARLAELHGNYYAGLNQTRQDVADTNAASRQAVAETNAASRVQAAGIRAGQAGNKTLTPSQLNKDTEERYGDLSANPVAPEQRGEAAELHSSFVQQHMTPQLAEQYTRGIQAGRYKLLRGADGSAGVIDKDPNHPVAYLPPEVAKRMLPPQQAQQSPIGAGANSAYAAGAGITSNLAGTTNPQQAIPTAQSSAVPGR